MPKSNVNNCSQLVRILLSAPARFCSRTVRNFGLSPYAICSRTVRNFAHGPYAILLSDRCSYSFLLSNRCSYSRPTGQPYLRQRSVTTASTYHSEKKRVKSIIDFTRDFESIVKSTHDLTVKSSGFDLRLILLSNQL